MQEMQVRSLIWEDPLEKEMATHSCILALGIPWKEEPGSYSPWSHKRIRHDLATKLSLLMLSHGMRSSDSSVGGPSINFFSYEIKEKLSFIEQSVDYCFNILRVLK